MNLRSLVFAAVVAVAPAAASSACPNCKAQIPNTAAESGAGVASGFNSSIYLMLASIVGVGGAVVRMLVREARQTDARHRPAETPER